MGNREEDKDNVRMSFQSKVFYNRLIIFSWFVYSKSAIFKAIQNPVHKHRAILYRKIGQATSTAGRQGAAPILDIRKGGYYKQQVSTKAEVQRRRSDPPHGSQPWRGQRTPGKRGSRGFQRETADGGGDTPLKPLPCPVSPGCQPGETGTGTGMMEAQPSEKTRLSQHLMLSDLREKSIF